MEQKGEREKKEKKECEVIERDFPFLQKILDYYYYYFFKKKKINVEYYHEDSWNFNKYILRMLGTMLTQMHNQISSKIPKSYF